VKRLGEILGTQAIVVGTITALTDRTVLRVRVLSVETGKVLSVGSVEIASNDPVLRALLGTQGGPMQGTQGSDGGGTFFKEDWTGTDTVGGARQNLGGVSYTVVQATPESIRHLELETGDSENRKGTGWVSRWVAFPEDFSLEFTCRAVAVVCLELSDGRPLPVSRPNPQGRIWEFEGGGFVPAVKTWFHWRIEKRGDVLKLFEDDKFILSQEFPHGVQVIGFTYLVAEWCTIGEIHGHGP